MPSALRKSVQILWIFSCSERLLSTTSSRHVLADHCQMGSDPAFMRSEQPHGLRSQDHHHLWANQLVISKMLYLLRWCHVGAHQMPLTHCISARRSKNPKCLSIGALSLTKETCIIFAKLPQDNQLFSAEPHRKGPFDVCPAWRGVFACRWRMKLVNIISQRKSPKFISFHPESFPFSLTCAQKWLLIWIVNSSRLSLCG